MNASPTEEVGQTARTLIDGFRSQPALLSLTIVNILVLGLIGWIALSNREIARLNIAQLGETQKLLAACIQPEQLERLIGAIIRRQTP